MSSNHRRLNKRRSYIHSALNFIPSICSKDERVHLSPHWTGRYSGWQCVLGTLLPRAWHPGKESKILFVIFLDLFFNAPVFVANFPFLHFSILQFVCCAHFPTVTPMVFLRTNVLKFFGDQIFLCSSKPMPSVVRSGAFTGSIYELGSLGSADLQGNLKFGCSILTTFV